MNDLQKDTAHAFKLRLDSLAEIGTIEEMDAVIAIAIDVAAMFTKHDSSFPYKEFFEAIEI
tara:strand:+ start:1539 stop:1721 length:183 start_codon:yes stop_codon:yes gene_type:complete